MEIGIQEAIGMNKEDRKPMILEGDCIGLMKEFDENTFDAIVTDPPYGLEFMGKTWDKLVVNKYLYANTNMQLWHTQWLIEAYRVLKPGGSMLVMGGTRTFHRLMVAIEDSGFIIKDTLMWIYGSGFPKAQELSKLVDAKALGISTKEVGERRKSGKLKWKGGTQLGVINDDGWEPKDVYETHPLTPEGEHWDGFKVGGIKPAYEPIVWAVKPPEGSYIDNVLKWGVGAVNVDECRVVYKSAEDKEKAKWGNQTGNLNDYGKGMGDMGGKDILASPKGRFPANIILDEEAGRVMDEQSGELKSGWKNKDKSGPTTFVASEIVGGQHFNDSGGASRFFYCAKASRGERNKGLEGMEKKEVPYSDYREKYDSTKSRVSEYPDGKERPMNKLKNPHPTVKPIKLFEYLIKLVTREGQIIIDPFLGSGTTMIAANNVDRECVGIEREEEYIKIAEKRVKYWLENREKSCLS